MKVDTNEALQWVAAVFIILGHVLNSVGPEAYPWNILAFFFGVAFFLIWSLRVRNRPQTVVNLVSLAIAVSGLIKSLA